MTSSPAPAPTPAWHHIDDAACRRFTASVELVGKRWSSGILLAIGQGATRFSDIVASVVGLSDRLLAQRLKELERAGLVARSVVATTPVQVRYSLTPQGADLLQSLQPLVSWGQRWGASTTADIPATPAASPSASAPAPAGRAAPALG
ncbi:winged helix-turn-helix transcriptional regulator [Herbiconiux ginsengi]|uniref:Transcriptional regulator, HxlR family n=1 Tax=Herbiconiux ginsengi TaxID=381665 RepID=A0A1H3RQP6_9MICO|nr:helix-turn-helix domain-containing protein [Herbiconiux ginsengi]SDZ28094.1 transcriptional regulator, HxlR family [Herbiconiux ginsengi]